MFLCLPPEILGLISQDSFALYSVFVSLSVLLQNLYFVCLPYYWATMLFTTSQQLLLFKYLCVNYTSKDDIFLIFSDIKMSLKVQFHNGLKPISDHTAAKRGNNFASPSSCIGISNFMAAQWIRSACFSKLKVKHAEGEGKLNLFCQQPVKQLWFEKSAAKPVIFCSSLPLTTCCYLHMSLWLHGELNWGTDPSEQ